MSLWIVDCESLVWDLCYSCTWIICCLWIDMRNLDMRSVCSSVTLAHHCIIHHLSSVSPCIMFAWCHDVGLQYWLDIWLDIMSIGFAIVFAWYCVAGLAIVSLLSPFKTGCLALAWQVGLKMISSSGCTCVIMDLMEVKSLFHLPELVYLFSLVSNNRSHCSWIRYWHESYQLCPCFDARVVLLVLCILFLVTMGATPRLYVQLSDYSCVWRA